MKSVLILTALALASAATLVMAAPEGQAQRAGMLERLKAADTNGDGFISRAEAGALPRIAERFDAIDANRDGQVSIDELRASHAKHRGEGSLKRLDTDGDGRMSKAEALANASKRFDARADGKVSKAEALAKASERFDRADANKDGFLTPDEMKAARHAHRGHPGK